MYESHFEAEQKEDEKKIQFNGFYFVLLVHFFIHWLIYCKYCSGFEVCDNARTPHRNPNERIEASTHRSTENKPDKQTSRTLSGVKLNGARTRFDYANILARANKVLSLISVWRFFLLLYSTFSFLFPISFSVFCFNISLFWLFLRFWSLCVWPNACVACVNLSRSLYI